MFFLLVRVEVFMKTHRYNLKKWVKEQFSCNGRRKGVGLGMQSLLTRGSFWRTTYLVLILAFSSCDYDLMHSDEPSPIEVIGSELISCGRTIVDDKMVPSIWLGSRRIDLDLPAEQDTILQGEVHDIILYEDSLYSIGLINAQPCIWKNKSILQLLPECYIFHSLKFFPTEDGFIAGILLVENGNGEYDYYEWNNGLYKLDIKIQGNIFDYQYIDGEWMIAFNSGYTINYMNTGDSKIYEVAKECLGISLECKKDSLEIFGALLQGEIETNEGLKDFYGPTYWTNNYSEGEEVHRVSDINGYLLDAVEIDNVNWSCVVSLNDGLSGFDCWIYQGDILKKKVTCDNDTIVLPEFYQYEGDLYLTSLSSPSLVGSILKNGNEMVVIEPDLQSLILKIIPVDKKRVEALSF